MMVVSLVSPEFMLLIAIFVHKKYMFSLRLLERSNTLCGDEEEFIELNVFIEFNTFLLS